MDAILGSRDKLTLTQPESLNLLKLTLSTAALSYSFLIAVEKQRITKLAGRENAGKHSLPLPSFLPSLPT